MGAMRDWQDLVVPGTPSRAKARAGDPGHAPRGKAVVIENVIVPLDGTEGSRAALPVGRIVAKLYEATLHVVFVDKGEEAHRPRQTLEELGLDAQEIRGVVMDNLHGDPAAAILRSARELSSVLLVMCTHTGGHTDTGELGSVAEAVLSGAPERIILISPEGVPESWQLRRILLAHDGTRSADVAIAPAADLAHRSGAEVLALHVGARTSPEPGEPGSLPAPRYIDQPQHEWPAWADEFLDRMMTLGTSPADVNFKLLVTGGQPGSEIAQFTRDNSVDLLVAASRGRWDNEHFEKLRVIIRRCGCPVLLVHTTEVPSR